MSKLLLYLVLVAVVAVLSEGISLRHGRRRHQRADMADSDIPDGLRMNPRRARRLMARHFSDFFKHFRRNWGFGMDWYGGFHDNEESSWWNGPNICLTKTENNSTSTDDVRHHHSIQTQSCDVSETVYTCTSTTNERGNIFTVKEVYECCHGFSRRNGDFGCPNELHVKSLTEKAKDLGLNEFIQALNSSDILEDIMQSGNFTVFAPKNGSFNNLPVSIDGITLQDMSSVVMVSRSFSEALLEDVSDTLLGHLVPGILTTSNFVDEQLLETGNSVGSTVRINIYDTKEQIITANCQRVTSADSMVTNGVVHVIDSMMKPVTDSLIDIISRNPELSYLKTAIGRTDFGQELRDDGQLTIFAPTDVAFRKLDPSFRDRVLSSSKCLNNRSCYRFDSADFELLKNHILPNVICSTVIQGRVRTINRLDKYVHLLRDDDDKLFANGTQILERDTMATNGVLYLIDDVLIPEEAQGILEVIKNENSSNRVLQLIKDAGLEKTLESAENITLFIPTDDALGKLDEEILSSLSSDRSALADVLKYHVGSGLYPVKQLYSGDEVNTLNPEKSLRIQRYTTPYSIFNNGGHRLVQCAQFTKTNVKSCNGIVHFIDNVLLPPKGNVIDILALDSRFSHFVELLKLSGLADVLQENMFTVFAVPNDVLGAKMKILRSMSEGKLKKFLSRHIMRGTVCCAASTLSKTRHFRRCWKALNFLAYSNEIYRFSNKNGQPRVEGVDITQCDVAATNGVVHVVSTILRPRLRFSNYFFEC